MVGRSGLREVPGTIDMRNSNVLFLISFCISCAVSCTSVRPSPSERLAAMDSPSETVERYCMLDSKGHRLSSLTYAPIRELMAWLDDRGEPGWDCFKVISGYKITNEKILEGRALVTVRYNVLKTVCGTDDLGKERGVEDIGVILEKLGR